MLPSVAAPAPPPPAPLAPAPPPPSDPGDLRCPRCGGPLELKSGRAGRFLGCASWPRCRGSLGVGDTGRLPGESAVAMTRRLALERLAATAPSWSAADREDAAQEALAAAIAGGWAERPTAWTFVSLHALRCLRGWQVMRGKKYSSRSAATPTASRALRLRSGDTQDPDTWLAERPISPDYEAAIDAAREYAPVLAAGLDRLEGPDLVARAVERGETAREIAAAVGCDYSGVRRWIRREVVPSEEAADRLRLHLVGAAPAHRPAPVRRAPPPPPADPIGPGGRAAAELRRRGWSRSAIAEAVGASPSAVSLWLLGRFAPLLDASRRLSALVASGAPPPKPAPPPLGDPTAPARAQEVAVRLRAEGRTGREIAAAVGCAAAQARAWMRGAERPSGPRAARLLELDAAGAFDPPTS